MNEVHRRRLVTSSLITTGIVGIAVAIANWMFVARFSDCPLGLEFERSESELVEQRAAPPRVTCRYYYREDGRELFPPEPVTPDPPVSTTTGIGAVLALAFVVIQHRHSSGHRARSHNSGL